MDNLYIRKINKDDLEKMIKMAEDKYKHGEMSEEKYLKWKNAKSTDFFENYLEKAKKREQGEGEIQGINFYHFLLLLEDEVIGTGRIRTNIENDDYFNNYSGHIGYTIIPSKRKLGYGSELLHLLIEKARELGMKEVMIVCLNNNIGSQKVIENNFGKYLDTVLDPVDNKYYKRYTINVEKSLDSYKKNRRI